MPTVRYHAEHGAFMFETDAEGCLAIVGPNEWDHAVHRMSPATARALRDHLNDAHPTGDAVEEWCDELGVTPQSAAQIINEHLTRTAELRRVPLHLACRVGEQLEVHRKATAHAPAGWFRAECVHDAGGTHGRWFALEGRDMPVNVIHIDASRHVTEEGDRD